MLVRLVHGTAGVLLGSAGEGADDLHDEEPVPAEAVRRGARREAQRERERAQVLGAPALRRRQELGVRVLVPRLVGKVAKQRAWLG